MLHQLGNIATVRTATIFREQSPKEDPVGNVRALTIKDVAGNWPYNFENLHRINIGNELLGNCLKNGEILIPSRGDHYPARYFNGSETNIFPIGQINLITATTALHGRYLSWYLNQPAAQAAIERVLTGSNIKALNKPSLLEIPIYVPSINTQHKICKLQEMLAESRLLRNRLLTLEEIEVEGVCRNLINKEKG